MSLFVQEEETLTDLVSEKVTRLIETLEIDTVGVRRCTTYGVRIRAVPPRAGRNKERQKSETSDRSMDGFRSRIISCSNKEQFEAFRKD